MIKDILQSLLYFLYFLLILFALIAFFITISSCNHSKKIVRQDNAALERVTAKRPLLDAAGAKWRDLNPCATDTTYITKEGQIITQMAFDTLYLPGTNDTVIKTVTKTITHNKVDTLVRIVVDKNALDSAKSLARSFELAVKDREVAIAATQAEANDNATSRNKWRLYFILLSIVTGALSFLYVKQQFFKI